MASERSALERATKIAVLVSTLGAVVFEALHAGRELFFLPALAAIAFLVGYAAGRRHPERAAGLLLATSYLIPALLLLTIGYRYWYLSVWSAACLGVMGASTACTWQYPTRLRFPLIAWALVVATSWPLVALRSLDWTPSLLWQPPSVPGDAVHGIPSAVWISQVALVHLLGLLWIDWLFGRFAHTALDRFAKVIIRPSLVGAVFAAILAVYQGFVDLKFLSIGVWWQLGRASGSLADGNASGALSALWAPIAVAFAVRTRSKATMATAAGAVVLLLAVWVSGSRTAFLCALIGLLSIGHIALTERAARWKPLIAAVGTVAALAGAWMIAGSSIRNPLARVSELLPGLTQTDFRSAARQLWERQGYGTAAVGMIKDEPLQGVGVGAYHLLSSDYYFAASHTRIDADNAQNWFRHQLAELGVLGSIGCLWWSLVFVGALITGRAAADQRTFLLPVKYTIAGFGAASLLGMPSQNLFVALTVWTFAFWLLLMIGMDREGSDSAGGGRQWSVVAAILLAVLFFAATAYAGWHDLRPPFVAKRFSYLYEYGVYESMDGPAGRTQTTGHAVTVMPAPTATLRLTVWVEHPDANEKPVRVKVWVDGVEIIRGHFPRNVPLTRIVQVPENDTRIVLETRVDRTFASPETGRTDVGLNVAWEFEGTR